MQSPFKISLTIKHCLTLIAFGVLALSGCGGGGGTTPNNTVQMGGARQGAPLNLLNTVSSFAGTPGGAGGAHNDIGTTAKFSLPQGLTTDGINVYVADTNNQTIRKIVIATGEVTTLAGLANTSGTSDSTDGTGATAQFNFPEGITTDNTNLYVSDSLNNTIRKIVIATGETTTLAGTGTPGAINDDVGRLATFNYPTSLTTDGTNLYVLDTSNHIIRKIVIATSAVTTLAGIVGVQGSANNVVGTSATFDTPYGITTDGTNLFVSDNGNHTIRKIVIATSAVTTLAGTVGVQGSANNVVGTSATFDTPYGIISDGTRLYVADTNNHTIRKIQ